VQIAPLSTAITQLGLMQRIVALTAALFFVPVLVLGAISPQVIRLAVTDVRGAGTVAGRVYAWSTAGAIAGTFAAGWALISLLGVYTLVFAVGCTLLAVGAFVGRCWRHAVPLVAAFAVAGGAVYAVVERDALRSDCTLETNYFCIRVTDTSLNAVPVKGLILDHLIHSYVKIGDPSFLGYDHEQVQAEFAHWMADRHADPSILVIGGGGYTYPRWVEAFVPTARIEVVEIDPGVTEVVHEYLDLPRETRIVSYGLDGRQFVQEMAPHGTYNLVVQDAVNDLSVPYHILTKEYNDHVRGLLAPDGIFLLTVIDLNDDGQLMRSAARTMAQTFPRVRLLAARPIWDYSGSSVWVIAGSNEPIDLDELGAALDRRGAGPMRTVAQPEAQLRAYTAQGPQIILTDQYAPVDNLISVLFAQRN
jgi:spermidine synthase